MNITSARRRSSVALLVATLATTIGLGSLAPAADAATTPKYKVQAVKFHVYDESGTDWLGSDEVYWIFNSVSNGVAGSRATKVYGSSDTGDVKTMAGVDTCVFQTNCASAAAPNGIGLSIQLWEKDSGSVTNSLRVSYDYFRKAGNLARPEVVKWLGYATRYMDSARDMLSKWMDNDLLGTQTYTYGASTLARRLPKVGNSFTDTRYFGGLGSSNGARYFLTLRVVRTA
jgi:hypothetical protein